MTGIQVKTKLAQDHKGLCEDLSIHPSGSYLSVTDNIWHVDMSVHTALYELHVVLC